MITPLEAGTLSLVGVALGAAISRGRRRVDPAPLGMIHDPTAPSLAELADRLIREHARNPDRRSVLIIAATEFGYTPSEVDEMLTAAGYDETWRPA